MLHNIWIVAKHAIRTTTHKRSFWIMTFIMPALMIGMLVFTNSSAESISEENTPTEQEAVNTLPKIGLVDEARLLAKLPERFPPTLFTRYPDTASAQAALEAGEVDQYIFVPADYVATGEITVFQENFQLFSSGANMGLTYGSESEWLLQYLINYNLTGSDQTALLLNNPTPGDRATNHIVNPPPVETEGSEEQNFAIATIVPWIFYFVLIISSGYLMQSVTAEKENRTVEILLLSVNPREFMLGKVLGLGVVTLIQLIVWSVSSVLITRSNDAMLEGLMKALTPALLTWLLVYLTLGYLLYGSIMAAAGALAPTAREGGQATWLMVIPLMPTLLFISEFADNPHGTLPLVLSLFPLTAPSAMVTRLALAPVPAWQVAVSLGGVLITVYIFISLAARFFRADNLLSTVAFSWKRFVSAWKS